MFYQSQIIIIAFNPRSLTGATRHTRRNIKSGSYFQSTLPHGSDRAKQIVTSCQRPFNPRSLTGATGITTCLMLIIPHFQSTLPHGSDHRLTHLSYTSLDAFNPRSLTGATRGSLPNSARTLLSIHAPSRERRQPVLDD